MKATTKPVVFLLSGLAILLGSALLFGLPQVKRAAQIGAAGRARLRLAQWTRAAEAYFEAHGTLPAGNAVTVLEALRHDAASREAFTDPGSPAGDELLRDPWGTAWRIQGQPRIEVRSAGPNGKFGDDDDLSSLSLGVQ